MRYFIEDMRYHTSTEYALCTCFRNTDEKETDSLEGIKGLERLQRCLALGLGR